MNDEVFLFHHSLFLVNLFNILMLLIKMDIYNLPVGYKFL
jgi:hypothetical protein